MEPATKPWEILAGAIETNDVERLRALLEGLSGGDVALSVSRLTPDAQKKLLVLLDPTAAASLITDVSSEQAADMIENLPAASAAAILDEVPSDQQADLLGHIEKKDAEAIIDQMSPDEAEDVRRLLDYPEDTAGGIMITEFLAYPSALKVGDLIGQLEEHRKEYADYSVQYLYVTDESGKLEGVLRMRDLIFSDHSQTLASRMIKNPINVRVDADVAELRTLFEGQRLFGLPVVDELNRLVGVVRRAAVEQATTREVNRGLLGVSGIVGGEEFRTMPMRVRVGRRLSWLSVNIVLNILAASVIALYQDTLTAVIALAVFLPMISDMSGCAGNQAVAVSIRELTLGLVKPNEVLRVFAKEIGVGVANGVVLGGLLCATAYLWRGNPYLGVVVGGALCANTVVAVSIGGVLPLALRRLRLDPALVSGPLLTTITDMCGFFFALSFATVLLAKLTAG